MDARSFKVAFLAAAIASLGANQRTANFIVTAPTQQEASAIASAAERFRRELAIEWLGREMPTWAQPCPITAQVGERLGAGGATSFLFEHGEVFGWRMTIQGSHERILDSVLPHEITHTIFATHFRRPLPRWADEGACTTVEHESEKTKQQVMLVDFLRTQRGIAFSRMFAMKEYPHDVMPLYSQGYSLARFLIAQGGKQKFLSYLADGMRDENWPRATQANYGFADLAVLQNTWLDWVRRGSPAIKSPRPTPERPAPAVLVDNDRRPRPEPNLIYRAQSSDDMPLASTPVRATGLPLPGPAADEPDTVAAAGSVKGWHSPGNGDSATEPANSETVPDAQVAAGPYAPAGTGRAASAANVDGGSHQMTRPQPTERPRQIILEWSKPTAATSAAAGATLEALATQPVVR